MSAFGGFRTVKKKGYMNTFCHKKVFGFRVSKKKKNSISFYRKVLRRAGN